MCECYLIVASIEETEDVYWISMCKSLWKPHLDKPMKWKLKTSLRLCNRLILTQVVRLSQINVSTYFTNHNHLSEYFVVPKVLSSLSCLLKVSRLADRAEEKLHHWICKDITDISWKAELLNETDSFSWNQKYQCQVIKIPAHVSIRSHINPIYPQFI
jgi:hypothetical protein